MNSMTNRVKTGAQPHKWTAECHIERLEDGLTTCILPHRGSRLVATALCYGAGSLQENAGEEGGAHFLEHMMFKGSSRYPCGEIDRLTQAFGGSNNAFTSHDCTLYYFSFASDRWKIALEIEADRMANLTLDPEAVDSERKVIFEELARAEADPWDVLDGEVRSELYDGHPYGRKILGSRQSLEGLGSDRLRVLHERLYSPGNAVLALVGDIDLKALDEIRSRFSQTTRTPDGDSSIDSKLKIPKWPSGLRRIERHMGEVARFMAALPGPSAQSGDFAALRLLLAILAGGRCSRLYRNLVDDSHLCSTVMADLGESVAPGAVVFALEAVPGIAPEAIEDSFWKILREARETGITEVEIERAKRMFLADWVFGFETVQSRAAALAQALCLFDQGYLERQRTQVLATTLKDLSNVAEKYLQPTESGIAGWSLPVGENYVSSGSRDC